MNPFKPDGLGNAKPLHYVVLTLLTVALVVEGAFLFLAMRGSRKLEAKVQDIGRSYVTIWDYNGVVRAHNQLTGTVTNQEAIILLEQGHVQALTQRIDALTNLYSKMEEYERQENANVLDIRGLHDDMQRSEGQLSNTSTNLAQMAAKLDSLQKGLIKMSLAVQDVQHGVEEVLQVAQTTRAASHPEETAQTAQIQTTNQPVVRQPQNQ